MVYKEKVKLINELIDIVKQMEKLWNYHPDNPDKIDVVDLYERYLIEKEELKKAIEKF